MRTIIICNHFLRECVKQERFAISSKLSPYFHTMTEQNIPVQRISRQHLGIILVAYALLCLGLVVPVASVTQLFLNEDSYSVLGGLINLVDQGAFFMALLVFAFSVAFPLGKLTVLLLLYLKVEVQTSADRTLKVLELLGKWSMFDLFVIAATFSAANLEIINEVGIRWGIYVYGLSIVLSMIATMLISWKLTDPLTNIGDGFHRDLLIKAAHASAFILFAVGISIPLAEVEKWLFWQQAYSLLGALPAFVNEGEWVMPLVLLVFVFILPVIRFGSLALCQWQSAPSEAMVLFAQFIDKWAMFDVYILAMLIVLIKLNDSAEVHIQAGFWCLLMAAMLSWFVSVRFHQHLKH